MSILQRYLTVLAFLCAVPSVNAADTVPIVVQMPGTQPGETSLEDSGRCDNCHVDEDYSPPVLIAHEWRGSAMSHAGRDPLFWATLAIAEQDFDGAGDLCIRCHTMGAWLDGSSTPTDGSALSDAQAADGVGCDVCHKMTNPDGSEHVGVQNSPFIAHDGGTPPEGYYGSGQLVLSDATDKLGPYGDAGAKHQWLQSEFHRSVDFCGSCHDVSNPVAGDLAPNNGAQVPLPAADAGIKYGGATLDSKAAFNYPPYKYGVVERTYSEYKAGLLSQTLVSQYDTDPDFPADLKNGSIKKARDAAMLAGTGGNYEDGTARYFSCQTCHMTPVDGFLGANKSGLLNRKDLPSHDLTGGNYWLPSLLQYMDTQDTLLLGGRLSDDEVAGLDAGAIRAKANLNDAVSLSVTNNTLRVTNLTGHKLITGYPEGRRMWLNVVWKDEAGAEVREDGKYGTLTVTFDVNNDGNIDINDKVETILDLDDPYTRIYEVHGAISQDWATALLTLPDADPNLPVSYDRVTGQPSYTLGQVAAQEPGTSRETFHFVLNNTVVRDNRIPPYGMAYTEAEKRNILPVPANQYGSPEAGGVYNYWDEFELDPPTGAVSATISLMYQPTSWEYVQFLYLANNGSVPFLASEGENLLDGWLNTSMAAPHVMATTTWTLPTDTDGDGIADFEDNCVDKPNTDQADKDTNGVGDVCEPPRVNGIWPGDGTVGETISLFVFGDYFDQAPGSTLVYVNGVQEYIVQVVTPEMLIVRLNVSLAHLGGPVTVATSNGSDSGPVDFGVPTTGLSISGMWPATATVGDFVFVFGSGYETGMTVTLNGASMPMIQVVSEEMFIMIVSSGANSGPVVVTTSTGTAASSEDLIIAP